MRFASIKEQVRSRSDAIRLACEWEVRAPKLGNVHPAAAFDDCGHDDFMRAAIAIAPVLGSVDRSIGLGDRVLSSVEATRKVTDANVNLGIILLIAPLAMAENADSVRECIASITAEDGRKVFKAIRLASPGGMKQDDVPPEHDVEAASTQPVDLQAAMRAAAHRDRIALQYATGFEDFFSRIVPLVREQIAAKPDVEAAIVCAHLRLMAQQPDSLIARKCGDTIAAEAQQRAIDCLKQDNAASRANLDAWLRADGNRRNPGTSADLIAASLYWLLSDG
ncbi:MAG: triphosphoribosyl-dephospho-CoA synthase [Planctomycetaceae bacterium]